VAIGFLPPSNYRHPVYGAGSRRLGYIEENGRSTWFQDEHGQRIARILRWKQDRPEIGQSLSTGTHMPWGFEDDY
jgi:hypothetical protein